MSCGQVLMWMLGGGTECLFYLFLSSKLIDETAPGCLGSVSTEQSLKKMKHLQKHLYQALSLISTFPQVNHLSLPGAAETQPVTSEPQQPSRGPVRWAWPPAWPQRGPRPRTAHGGFLRVSTTCTLPSAFPSTFNFLKVCPHLFKSVFIVKSKSSELKQEKFPSSS